MSPIKVGAFGKRITDAMQQQLDMTLTGVASELIEEILFAWSMKFPCWNIYEHATWVHPLDTGQTAVVRETEDQRR